MKLKDIASLVQGELIGDGEEEILRAAKIQEARKGDISFIANPKYEKYLESTKASAIIVAKSFDQKKMNGRKSQIGFIKVDDPYLSFLYVLRSFYPPLDPLPAGIHPTALIAKTALLGKNIAIGAHVVIGERCCVGNNTKISHGTVLGDDVEIGDDTLIYPNITVREQCKIGNRVIIHSGTVVGSDGFGFAPKKDGSYEKIPQIGIVVIEDDVEIGANCAIDRATMGETRIKRGAKLDNLIQVAHNVTIGEHTVIAGQAGISGSTNVGAHCMIGGQVGIVGHSEIADNIKIIPQSGVSKSLTQSGETYFGAPAKPAREGFRIEAALRQLPEALEIIRKLQHRIEELEIELRQKDLKKE